jgi:hypothetical protein
MVQKQREEYKNIMKLKRALYLGYYIKQLNRGAFNRFLEHAAGQTGRSKITLVSDLLQSVFRYNISILEYFQFRFYELDAIERATWAGTGYMYEYQLKMNPLNQRDILDDKRLFYRGYSEFFVHTAADGEDLLKPGVVNKLLANPSGKLVFKSADGKCGAQVEIRRCSEFTSGDDLIAFMNEKDYGLVEEFIIQHPFIQQLSPSAVNTVRVFTQLNRVGEVEILGCRLRISVNSPVDNMAAGNLAAAIDDQTGMVTGPGVYSDITKKPCVVHPVTGVEIPGFQVPRWNEVLDLVKKAALKHPQNRSIGWDVVITERGPGLIEGNHDWCKLLWQLPVQQGLKHLLEGHLKTLQAVNGNGRSDLKTAEMEYAEADI